MKNKLTLALTERVVALLLLSILNLQSSPAFGQGTAFTYQGRLNNNGAPASGSYDFQFKLYNNPTSKIPIGGSLQTNAIPVNNGLFMMTLDFGPSVFTGTNYWLEVDVRTNGAGVFTPLSPVQAITPAPYAVFANTASNVLGTIPLAQLPSGILTNNASSVTFASSVTTPAIYAANNSSFLLQGSSGSGAGAGGDVSLNSGLGGTTGSGGNINLISAASGSLASGSGGNVNISAGTGGNGGTVNLMGGASGGGTFSGGNVAINGGNVAINGGNGGTSGNGGVISLIGGNGSVGGNVNLSGGTSPGGGAGGNISILSGGNSSLNSISNSYSTIVVQGIGLNPGDGGSITVEGGHNTAYGSSSSSGGNMRISGGNGTGGYSGGNIVLLPGTPGGYVGIGKNNPLTTLDVAGSIMANKYFGSALGLADLNATNLIGIIPNAVLGMTIERNSNGAPNFINGGDFNYVSGGVVGGTIGGGGATNYYGAAYTNSVTGDFGTVAGGAGNTASGKYSSVAGGGSNTASGNYSSVIGGGGSLASGQNSLAFGMGSTASGTNSTALGSGSTASGQCATVSGGCGGNVASGDYSTVGGGYHNSAFGNYSVIPGGTNNVTFGDNSFAGGRNATANNAGSFVWGDNSGANTFDVSYNQFVARASGGFFFYTSSNNTVGAQLPAGSGSWSSLSDRNAKENFASVDAQSVLQEVAAMPLTTWNYKTQDKTIRHIGPMAQDFHTAFAVGEDDRHITEVDEGGVALAAIQGLNQKLEEARAENTELKKRLEALEKIVLNQKSN
jgi:hypothetical protein